MREISPGIEPRRARQISRSEPRKRAFVNMAASIDGNCDAFEYLISGPCATWPRRDDFHRVNHVCPRSPMAEAVGLNPMPVRVRLPRRARADSPTGRRGGFKQT